FVAAAAWWLAGERLRAHREQTWTTASVRLTGVKNTLELTFRQLAAMPRNLAHRALVIDFLATPQRRDPAVSTMNAMLDNVVDDFGLPLVALLDAEGRTVAIGIADKQAASATMALDLRDREYFVAALRDGESSQFLLGRLSRAPGVYFAHRIDRDGRVIGVAVIKQNAQTLNSLLTGDEDSTICVTDANGVVVLGNRSASLL